MGNFITIDNTVNLKKKLRQSLLAKRKQLTKIQVIGYSAKAYENFQKKFNKEVLDKVKIISGYTAIRNEIDVLSILNWLFRKNIKIVFPKIIGKNLKFYEWDQIQPSVRNKFNIKEPVNEKEIIPELLIIPVVGFDENCNRIGYGFGYYDRILSKLQKTIKVGIGYSFQQVEKVPLEAHDVKLDYTITEK